MNLTAPILFVMSTLRRKRGHGLMANDLAYADVSDNHDHAIEVDGASSQPSSGNPYEEMTHPHRVTFNDDDRRVMGEIVKDLKARERTEPLSLFAD